MTLFLFCANMCREMLTSVSDGLTVAFWVCPTKLSTSGEVNSACSDKHNSHWFLKGFTGIANAPYARYHYSCLENAR